jgi:hypothetical protein
MDIQLKVPLGFVIAVYFISTLPLLINSMEKKLIVSQLVKNPPFMGPEGSLTCSQQPATGPLPEPDQSNPHHQTLFLWDPF